jgi:hypothetical protein
MISDFNRIIAQFEEFCCGPDFTNFVQEFIMDHAQKFEVKEEQDLE